MMRPLRRHPLFRLSLPVFFLITRIFAIPQQSVLVKYPFKADFSVRAARLTSGELQGLSVTIINKETRSFDSLAVQLYFRAGTGFEGNFRAILDLCYLYPNDGSLKSADSAITAVIPKCTPVKIADTDNSTDQTSSYYLRIPLEGISLGSLSRLRFDLMFVLRDADNPDSMLLQPPQHTLSDADWSIGPHSTAQGDLTDFSGTPLHERSAIDEVLWNLPVDYYITVHRGDELLWGIPPDWQTQYSKTTFLPIDLRAKQDPMPYAPIAVPFDEYEDQRVRDSANLRFSPIRINQAGYRPEDKKYFYHVGNASSFSVVDKDGKTVGSGTFSATGTSTRGQLSIRASNNALFTSFGDTRYSMISPVDSGMLYEGVLPDLPEGSFRIKVDSAVSAPFIIHHGVYNMIKDALLKFYGINRCGNTKSWFHPACHTRDAVTGGWHDCGDHLKEGATMSYTAAVLGLAAAVFSDRDLDTYDADQSKTITTDGIPDILYEAKVGADFILQSYDLANGDVSKMITSVGDFGKDHMWWGPPELQDNLPANRGGGPREGRNEATTDYLGKYAANLAFVAKRMKPLDAAYSDRCLAAAKTIYTYTKNNIDVTNTPAYNGSAIASDDAALGCLALLWATGEKTYLDELCFDTTIGRKAMISNPRLFSGGWFTYNDPLFTHTLANTDWASVQTHVLWGFFRLILNDQEMCEQLAIDDTTRLSLIEKTVHNLICNLASIGTGTKTITLPENDLWIQPVVKYAVPWFDMHPQMEWTYNKYQAGNITEMFYYYDIASKIQGITLPNAPATTDWKAGDVKDMLVRQLDYMLGVNPWDISMIYGVGAKNFNHPHHRAANPELRNTFYEYPYRHPVGALQGGYLPSTVIYDEEVADYDHSEVGIDATTNIFMPVVGLSSADYKVNSHRSKHPSHGTGAIFIAKRISGSNILKVSATEPVRCVSLFTVSGRLVAKKQSTAIAARTLELTAPSAHGMFLITVQFADGHTVSRRLNHLY